MGVVFFTGLKTTFHCGSFFWWFKKTLILLQKRRRTKRHIVQEQITQHPMTNSATGLPSVIIRLVVAGLSWVALLYTVG